MTRLLSAAAAVFALAAPATAQAPKLGAATQVEFTGKEPGMQGVPRLDFSAYKVKVYDYPIEAGDRFRVEMEAVGGVEMGFWVFAFKDSPEGFVLWEMMNDEGKGKVDWSMAKAPPGKRVRIFVGSTDVGKVNVRISKVGMPAGDPAAGITEELKKLREELEALRKENAELRKQLTDLKKK